MLKTFIYVLKCPITNQVRYVGKANNPQTRYQNHLNKAKDKNTYKRNWINKLKENKLKPILEVIAEVDKEEWKSWEKFYIKKYIDEGCSLVNCTDGGDGLTFGNQTSYKKGSGSIPIICLDIDGSYITEYSSTKEAEELTGINTINACLCGDQKKANGLLWIKKEKYIKFTDQELKDFVLEMNTKMTGKISKATYFNKGHKPWNKNKSGYSTSKKNYNLSEEQKLKISNTLKGKLNSGASKPVYQLDKINEQIINEYPSVAEAKRQTGIKGILNALCGICFTSGGYKWRYKNE